MTSPKHASSALNLSHMQVSRPSLTG